MASCFASWLFWACTYSVDRILDTFSNQYCEQNQRGGNWNVSSSATHTLVFALMMLHTDQHNASLKRQRTMDLEQFVNLVRQVPDAQKLDIETLEMLYTSMTTHEMKLCDDDSNMLSGNDRNISLSSWNLLIERAQNVERDPKVNIH